MTQTIALCGATGTAGRATAIALRDAGHHVTTLGRRPARIDGVRDLAADVTDLASLTPALARIKPQSVVSCLASRTGTAQDAWAIDHDANLALLSAAQAAGAGHFVLLSAICVQKPRLAFQHAKLAFEEALRDSGLTYSIVRPTAFFKSVSGQFDRVRKGKPYLLFGDGTLTACTPISDGDLGRYIAGCLTDPTRQNAILPIGGPGPALTPRDMGAALFAALGRTPRYRSISPRVIEAIAATLAGAGRLHSRLAAKAELARIGHYYATESMLVWDAQQGRYRADATPAFGTDRLPDFYRALANGTASIDKGDHAVF